MCSSFSNLIFHWNGWTMIFLFFISFSFKMIDHHFFPIIWWTLFFLFLQLPFPLERLNIFFPPTSLFSKTCWIFLVPYNQPLLCNGWIFCKTKQFYNSWTFNLSPITTLSFKMDGTFSFYLYSRMGVLSFVPYNHPLLWNGWTIFWKTFNTCSCGLDKHFFPLI